MAGDWIKMRVGLWTHPKVVTLSSRCAVTRAHTVGALFVAWCIADQHADQTGTVLMTGSALDSMCETPGLAAAMESVGWLIVGESSLQFVEYQEHNGTTGKTRANDMRRQRVSRSRHASVTAKRDNNVTREEKRREEKKTNTYARHKPFVKPTLEDVQAYCRERSNSVDPQKFIDFYESKGWMVGKNAMKDWKASVRTWERNPVGNGTGGFPTHDERVIGTVLDAFEHGGQ